MTDDGPPVAGLFNLSAEDIEELLTAALPHSTMFAVQFRYNAARSLLLPRSRPQKRIPLWLQRYGILVKELSASSPSAFGRLYGGG
jgi:ATP-dependent Lhr-like helicase